MEWLNFKKYWSVYLIDLVCLIMVMKGIQLFSRLKYIDDAKFKLLITSIWILIIVVIFFEWLVIRFLQTYSIDRSLGKHKKLGGKTNE